MKKAATLHEALQRHVRPSAPQDCWLWQGSRHKNGNGHVSFKKKTFLAHRVAWECAYGPVPPGLGVGHHCGIKHCCNPAHLFVSKDPRIHKAGTPMPATKRCALCHKDLPVSMFHPRYKAKPHYQLAPYCKPCNAADLAARRKARRPTVQVTLKTYFFSYVTRAEDDVCWPWNGSRNLKGYGMGMFKRRGFLGHRLAYELFKGPLTAGRYVCHTCDNPPCCNPAHLYLGTAASNTRDALLRQRRGKLTHDQICEIRRLREEEHLPYHAIKDLMNLPYTTVYLVGSRKTWKSLP